MTDESTIINWEYSGKPDFLIGTGATKAETWLVWGASLIGLALYIYLYATHALTWTWWQYLLAVLIAMDVFGGVVANSLNSCKRIYHSPAKLKEPAYAPLLRNHLAFSALHIYPLIASVFYGAGNYTYGLFWYLLMIVFSAALIKTPLYLRRPVSFLFISLALVLNFYVVTPIHGFEWLAPALYIKILYGHLVKEEPYRPATEQAA